MKCKICGNESKLLFEDTILGKYSAQYFYCEECGFLSLKEPKTWLGEAYKEAINTEDTGILFRNEHIRNYLSIVLYHLFDKNDKFLDFAGGYGLLTRMMRDMGFDFYWNDLYCKNLTAIGFQGSLDENYSGVTSFESFEHFVNPIEEIEKMLALSKTIIFTTELLPNPVPRPNDWWYYGLSHGQHISFYSEKTLNYIAKKYDLNYYNVLGLQLLTKEDLTDKIKVLRKKLKKNKILYKLIRPFVKINPILVEINKIKNEIEPKTSSDSEKMAKEKLARK